MRQGYDEGGCKSMRRGGGGIRGGRVSKACASPEVLIIIHTMKNRVLPTLLICAVLAAATEYTLRAQTAPGAGRGGGQGFFGGGRFVPPGPPAPVPPELAIPRPTTD